MEHCPRMCQACGERVDPAYDVRRLPKELKSVAWMVGRWRSEFGGKAFFPTIPKFTYGEQIDISISDITRRGKPSLNYTAFAWDISVPETELVEIHSENGYISVNHDENAEVDIISLTTAMSNAREVSAPPVIATVFGPGVASSQEEWGSYGLTVLRAH
ncbi:hypothetical protein ANCDUO_13211 [Ancylostoma duodenale]|uniref:THAP4-like heme-binding domain-containing protein n=1 Tax=Ancylostoma duodenale TaxID=51022 RepID=A0A0C2GHQ7_9BILA|nr:hypothetical protein ANCDUO_13211 [Ancylostoma duodenale]